MSKYPENISLPLYLTICTRPQSEEGAPCHAPIYSPASHVTWTCVMYMHIYVHVYMCTCIDTKPIMNGNKSMYVLAT